MKTEMWYTERQPENVGITFKSNEILHFEKTKFQELAIINTLQFGRMLVLDGTVQTTEMDEYVYHEMISHLPVYTHKDPKRVLIVGGGDGGAVREFIKHDSIEEVVLVEIDNRVTELCIEYFPNISKGLASPKVKVLFEDGIEYIKKHSNYFDIITVDCTDPVGPAEGLFVKEFYKAIYDALKTDGLFVGQTESPFFHMDLIRRVFKDISELFPVTRLYVCSIPTYPSGTWTFTMGSKLYKPEDAVFDGRQIVDTEYYNFDIHRGSLAIPNFLRKYLNEVK